MTKAPSARVRKAQHGTLLTKMSLRLPALDTAERMEVIDAFATLVEGLYTHLPLKRAMYGIDPLQRLRLLGRRAASLDDFAFHKELAAIMTGLRDAHTRYVGPARLEGAAAMLPFLVESYGAPPKCGYLVSKVSDARLVGKPSFRSGVELVWWNGTPIDRAVDLYAEQETGGRPDTRRARALESMTFRSLQYGPPPDEHWVDIGYRDLRGVEREVRIPWRVVKPRKAASASTPTTAFALDPGREAVRRAKKLLFAYDQWQADQKARKRAPKQPKAPKVGELVDTTFPDNISAKVVTTPSGEFGCLRLWSFDLDDDAAFVDEVARLLCLLPPDGLIIDLRGNPGGLIWAAERLLQLFGPQHIVPTRFSLLATPLTRAIAGAPQNEAEFAPWRDSLDDAVATGETYSQAVPITPIEQCNDIGQVYGGPVVAIADANTYSAGDLFASGFYDNDLGILVTVGEATGAGGANVWMPEHVHDALLGTRFEAKPLPAGIGYSISARRATRATGAADGAAIEDVGIRGHRTYAMTREDLTGGNNDLMAFCGKILTSMPTTRLDLEDVQPGAEAVVVTTAGLDRVDVYLDDRPEGWVDVSDGETTKALSSTTWKKLEVRGFADGELRQRRFIRS